MTHGEHEIADATWERAEVAIALGALREYGARPAFVIGSNDEILAWNPRAAGLFRLPVSRALGSTFSRAEIGGRVPALAALVARIKAARHMVQAPGIPFVGKGIPDVVSIAGAPVYRPNGDMLGVIVWVDGEAVNEAPWLGTTQMRAVFAELESTVGELEAARTADRRKDQVLSMLSHELRTPLGSILAMLSVIRAKAAADDAVDRACSVIERHVKYQARLLENLLDTARLTEDKLVLHHEPVHVGAIVRHALELTEEQIRARRHAVAVSAVTESLVVRGDPVRLTEVVANLLSNAAKFTAAGGRITVTLDRDSEHAILTVADTGIGVAPHMAARIFEPFVQGEAPSERQGGLGIGLFLVRRLVELHGGTVEAKSSGAGQGTEFVVRLPLAA